MNKGFAVLIQTEEGKNRQREIARRGGKAAQFSPTVHRWDSEEGKKAGRKGGLKTQKRK